MRIGDPAILLAAACLAVFPFLGGCASNKQAVRSGGSGVAIRLPPVESMDVRLRSNRPEAPPDLPYSISDETRGRWLTLFEVTVSPVETGNLPGDKPSED